MRHAQRCARLLDVNGGQKRKKEKRKVGNKKKRTEGEGKLCNLQNGFLILISSHGFMTTEFQDIIRLKVFKIDAIFLITYIDCM